MSAGNAANNNANDAVHGPDPKTKKRKNQASTCIAVEFGAREYHADPKTDRAAIPYRPEIDGLRAAAVLAVIFAHASFDVVKGGVVDVGIFFVLSGYLFGSIIFRELENNTFCFRPFLAMRGARKMERRLFDASPILRQALGID